MKPQKDVRKHHYLACGQIVFAALNEDGTDDSINVLSMNGIITQDKTNITRDSLGKFQQTLQINFHERMKGQKFRIIDCVIQNIMHLGHMLQKEFFETPDGLMLKEKSTIPETSTVGAMLQTEGAPQ